MGSVVSLKKEPAVKQEARPVLEGSGKKEREREGEWCAVCHDGGDTLYCCDNCPKVATS